MKRNSVQIRSWMVRKDIKPSRLARELNVHHTLVSQTVSGTKNNRRVLKALLAKGCPKKWLALPQDFDTNSQQAA
ncbi:XRE family transcriptional regulator [Desulfocurvibacter africanus]|uniref:XRE family transcriptional regulator n=1 Tax=Desulfocurvibacter africanus TaxID=873 RepID=UPI002FDB3319